MGAELIPRSRVRLETRLASALDARRNRGEKVARVLAALDFMADPVLTCKALSAVVFEVAPNESACRGVATAAKWYCREVGGAFCQYCPLPLYRVFSGDDSAKRFPGASHRA